MELYKKKERSQNEMKHHSLRNKDSFDSKDSDLAGLFANSNSFNNVDLKENGEKFFSIINKDKIKSFYKSNSADVSELTSKSVNVVADIHQEYEEKRSCSSRSKQNEAVINFPADKKLKKNSNLKALSKTSTLQDKVGKRHKRSLAKQRNVQSIEDDIKVIDAVDLVEDFKDVENEAEVVTKAGKLTARARTLEEKSHNRKQWNISISENEEQRKPARKRWSKDASIIRLPEASGIPWTNVSSENKSPLIQEPVEILETAHSSIKRKSENLFGIDNIAYESGDEEILRIETSNGDGNAKVEMKSSIGKLEYAKVSQFVHRNLQNMSNGESEAFEQTAVAIENVNEDSHSDARSIEDREMNVISNIEHFEESDNSDESSGERGKCKSAFMVGDSGRKSEKSLSDNSNSSQILGDVVTQTDNYSSKELSLEEARSFTKNRNKRRHKKQVAESRTLSNNRSISASEDDDIDNSKRSVRGFDDNHFEEDRAAHSSDGHKLRKSSTKKKKSKFTENQPSMKRKTGKKDLGKSHSSTSLPISSANAAESTKKKKKKKKDVKYISVTIHRADMLEVDYVTKHPMVKVHIVSAENGKYLKNDRGPCTYLQPVITGSFDFKENRSMVPVWEEEVIFEHDFDEILQTEKEQVVILFELVDLLSFAEASFQYDKFGHESCWHKIAWAFLKPQGVNNALHIDKKVRLQLYKPQKHMNKFEGFRTCAVYAWWKSNAKEKYPSSLFVTVKAVDPPKIEPVFYRQLSLHDYSNAHNESQLVSTRASDSISLPKWSRLAAQSCKVPNETVFETETSENGCFFVAFSNDGKYLAYSCSEEHDYPIVVYEVEGKKIHVRFSGHKTFVYTLNWSNNNNYLLSASSDQTARIWDVKHRIVQHVEMMPHPSYVYCGKFEPENASVVATGCYDRIVRIWIRDKKSKSRALSQELQGHDGFINSMCFQKNGDLLTADSVGVIILWLVKKSRRVLCKNEWHISRKIKVREIDGVVINTIVLHPLETRLLVHSRNNELRMLDLATGVVLQKYNQLNNQRIQTTACISPCGGLILCGGEDTALNIWSLETGTMIAKYIFDRSYRAVTCVDYHPYDHVLAYSTFGSPSSVRILRFNKDSTGKDIGLHMMAGFENTLNNSNVSTRFLNRPGMHKDDAKLSNENATIEEASKKRSLQSSRTGDSSHFKSSDDITLESDKYSDIKTKLQRLNEAGQHLKSSSASRLYNIIEKIDRILSNTSRSSGDIESGKKFCIFPDSGSIQASLNFNDSAEEKRKKNGQRNNKGQRINIEDEWSSYFQPSVKNSDKQEAIELHRLQKPRTKCRDLEKGQSGARTKWNGNASADETPNYISNSPKNSDRVEIYNEISKTMSKKRLGAMEDDNRKSVTAHKNNHVRKDETSSSDSAGTYIIEKNVAQHSDKTSSKILQNKEFALGDAQNSTNINHSESESSLLSNATFTIENEVPIPKPRRKNVLNIK